jgi:hypothetical protein
MTKEKTICNRDEQDTQDKRKNTYRVKSQIQRF